MALTAADMDLNIGYLDTDIAWLDQQSERIAYAIERHRAAIGDADSSWEGPRAEAELSRARDYLDAVAEAPRAIQAQAEVIGSLKRVAIEIHAELCSAEAAEDSAMQLYESINPIMQEQAPSRLTAALLRIDAAERDWQQACGRTLLGDGFNSGATAIGSSSDARLGGGTAWLRNNFWYLGALSRFAIAHDFTLDEVDPSGEARTLARWQFDDLLDSDVGLVIAVAADTANRRNDDFDQFVSRDDVAAMTDPVVAMGQIEQAASRLDIELDEASLAHLTTLAVGNAHVLNANWSDDTERRLNAALDSWAAWQEGQPEQSDRPTQTMTGGDVLDYGEAVGDVAAPESTTTKLLSRANTAYQIANVFGECFGDGDCGPAVGEAVADTVGSVAFTPMGWFVLRGLAEAYGDLDVPYTPPNWSGLGAGPGEHPHDVARGSHSGHDDTPLMPNGADPNGTLNYGGPDQAAIDFYGGSAHD